MEHKTFKERTIQIKLISKKLTIMFPLSWCSLFAWLLAVVSIKPVNLLVSKPGCPSHCGNITIPYPFGIGSGCSLSLGYTLLCDNSTDPPTTFIPVPEPQTNFEVLDISASEVRIRNKAFFQCFNHQGKMVSNQSVPLMIFPGHYPYSFSASANKFTVIGCDVRGLINGTGGSGELRGACGNRCRNQEQVIPGYCSSNGCCQTAIPKGMNGLSISITLIFDHEKITGFDPCAYGFVGEADQFVFQGVSDFDPNFANRLKENVPIVLDWVIIGNQTCSHAQQDLGSSYVCQQNTKCIDADNSTGGYLCFCLPGYDGNSYLQPGCKDIDECADEYSNRCSNICTNTLGSYKCSCAPGFSGDGFRNGTGCFPNPSLVGMKVGLGTSLGALLLLIGISWTYILIQRRRLMKLKELYFQQNGGLLLKKQLSSVDNQDRMESAKIFTIEELKIATKNFSEQNILGRGGYGTVYKGLLPNNGIVAIKKSKTVDQSQIKQFINEVVILSGIDHRNVVKLLGCCLETKIPLLVYEFIPNGTLFDHIHNKSELSWLNWSNCLRVAIEAAEALAYLHSAANTPVVHRDVKSTNILIDDSYAAKISDFGASRLVPLDYTLITTIVEGTLGYLDPEYFLTSKLTEKSDVYSFGVVLAELLTRQKPFLPEKLQRTTDRTLATYFVMSIKEGHIFETIDPQLVKEAPQEQLIIVAKLVEKCLSGKGEDRPAMRDVANELRRLRKRYTIRPWEYQEENVLYPILSNDQTTIESGSVIDSSLGVAI